MAQSTAAHPIKIICDLRPLWWVGTVAFFICGDLVTTFVGLRLPTVVEAGPVTTWLVTGYGVGLIIPIKLGVVAGLYGLSRLVPRPHSVGVPLGLCALGVVVTVWNGAVIAAAVA